MANYTFTYRCRYCGKTFTESLTGSERLAFRCVISAICEPGIKPIEPQAPKMLSIHIETDHYGVADFIGCKIDKGDND